MNAKKLGPSAVDIQNHLYASFLEGDTADVALCVHGSWNATYMLHRVVLIQSGFFRSLFTAGFAESSPRLSSGKGADDITIHFDDPNITRAGEALLPTCPVYCVSDDPCQPLICISRLYGGGPPLDIAPSLIPSLSQPLTPSFPKEPPPHKTPANHHPATPRFLLSLLATAVYLSIPSLASQALSSILSTIGPHTVLRYLFFALGHPITLCGTDSNELEAAVGLETVARMLQHEHSSVETASVSDHSSIREHCHTRESPLDSHNSASSTYSSDLDYEATGATKQAPYHYGAISDKIGEACACWLARWGPDLLVYEESLGEQEEPTTTPFFRRKRSKTLPSGSRPSNTDTSERKEDLSIPLIWSRGGLNVKWVNAIISADTFFIKGERERYDFARRVVELRRKNGIIPTEEEQWTKLFERGIYYANMTMEDLISISRDISPMTKEPFVPLSTLQAAHWTQSMVRHHITSRPASFTYQTPPGSMPSPALRDKELGITQTSADILASSAERNSDQDTYFHVSGNASVRLGDNGSSFNGTSEGQPVSMEQLFASTFSLSPSPSSPTLKPSTIAENPSLPTSEADYFGLCCSTYTASSAIASDAAGSSQWSPYPPCRFAVEFWDLEALKEKSRLYSHTVWYAGSLFNVYVQVVRKKGQVQLGIYLHRQSSIEPIPPSSAPATLPISRIDSPVSSAAWTLAKRTSHGRELSVPTISPQVTQLKSHYSPSIYPASRSTTPLPAGSIPTTPSSPTSTSSITLPATAQPVTPPQPFRDPRPSICAYFTISCTSATGSSQTRFTSSPDVFSVGQSWGWKSSTLRTEEFMDVRAERADSSQDRVSDQGTSLRATVVLGLI